MLAKYKTHHYLLFLDIHCRIHSFHKYLLITVGDIRFYCLNAPLMKSFNSSPRKIFVYLFRLPWVFIVARGLNCPIACGILVPQPGIKPVSPALEGRFLTTGPPGKSPCLCSDSDTTSHSRTPSPRDNPCPACLMGLLSGSNRLAMQSMKHLQRLSCLLLLRKVLHLSPFLESLRISDNPLQYSCLENPMDGEAW